MRNKFFILCLVCFTILLTIISLSYLSKNKITDTELTYNAEVSAVKYDDTSNTKLLLAILQDNTAKAKEEINTAKEKKSNLRQKKLLVHQKVVM